MQSKAYFVHALSPLHAGTGQGVGVIDLPIAREKATGIPYLPGSSIKGVLRDQGRGTDAQTTLNVFGPEAENAGDYAGAVVVSDAHLLLLPVRSLLGTYAWVTSPYLLHRFVRDAAMLGIDDLPEVVRPSDVTQCYAAAGTAEETHPATVLADRRQPPTVYLEDLDLHAQLVAGVNTWAARLGEWIFPDKEKDAVWRTMLAERLCIVHDDVLGFLLETATEVVARIQMKQDTKTVKDGALWYEEALPAETILSGITGAQTIRTKSGTTEPATVFDFVKKLSTNPLQFGGSATVGRGICRFIQH